MNAKQIRQSVSIVNYLESRGLNPQRINERKAYYFSPLRNEKDASFKVDINKNLWYDYGTGIGGNVIDLCMRLESVDVSGAIRILSKLTDKSVSFSSHPQKIPPADTIIIKHVQNLQNKALLQYLKERKIPLDIAVRYLQEAYYTVRGKQFFALAFKNKSGGYELRNKYFKGSSSPKDYTVFEGVIKNKVAIFEGFFDFLSALAYYKSAKIKSNVIVLNSLSNLDAAMPKILNYSYAYTYFDNDDAGRKASDALAKARFDITLNMSDFLYPEHKDFNEFLTK